LGRRYSAAHAAVRVRAITFKPFEVGGAGPRVVTSSMGIAIYPDDAEDSAGLQRKADEQMYLTKQRGRNGYPIGPRIQGR
jgi:GGDEF domain-containing protein